jgi:hypothetical protein
MHARGWCHAYNVPREGSGRQIDQIAALGKAYGPPGSPMDGDGAIRASAADRLGRLLSVEMTLTKGGSPASHWQQSDVDMCYVLESKVRTCVAGVPAPVGAGNKIAECWPAMRTPRVSSAVMVGG